MPFLTGNEGEVFRSTMKMAKKKSLGNRAVKHTCIPISEPRKNVLGTLHFVYCSAQPPETVFQAANLSQLFQPFEGLLLRDGEHGTRREGKQKNFECHHSDTLGIGM